MLLHLSMMGPAMHGDQAVLAFSQQFITALPPPPNSCKRKGRLRHATRCSKIEQTRQGSNGTTGLGLIETGSNGSVSVLPVELPPEATSLDPDTNGGAGSGGGEDGAGGRGGGGDDGGDGAGGRGRPGRSWLPGTAAGGRGARARCSRCCSRWATRCEVPVSVVLRYTGVGSACHLSVGGAAVYGGHTWWCT